MLFDRLVTTSADLRGVRARNKKRALLATLLADTPPSLVPVVVAYLSGDLPQGKIGLGWAAVRDAQTRGAPTPTLTVEEVDRSLEEIGRCEGAGSQKEKHERFTELLARATEAEQSFLGQLVIGELRQGALEGVMLDAIAQAFEVPLAAVRRAAMMAGSAPEIGRAAATEGEAGLDRFQLTLFRPVQPMLAQPAEEVDDALDRHGESAFEVKVDGARIQIHKRGNDVRIYTRGLHDVTERVPDIVEVVRAFPAQELIADGEAVALRGDGRPEPFQVTMGRFGGRLEVNAMRESVPLTTYLFDCLWLDGEALIDLSLSDRFTALQRGTSEAVLLPRIITSDRDKAQQFFEDSLAAGHEGAMAKALSAPYQAGGRKHAWLKLKKAHTLDLVVLAVEWGSGRRKGFLSNLHLGARDEESGEYVMLGKTFKGMTDEILAWQTEKLLGLEVQRDGGVVYVEPKLVVEIAFNDVQSSRTYPGGYALRFARLKRYREDKTAEAVDTMSTVAAIFEASGGRSAAPRPQGGRANPRNRTTGTKKTPDNQGPVEERQLSLDWD